MKVEKLTEEEKLTNQIKNFSIEEVESYLELLLTKGLEAVAKDDYASYGSIEKTLNNSLIIFHGKVRNFNILYNSIKLRVANKFLKKLLNNNSLSILDDVNVKGGFLTVEEAKQLLEAEEYKKYVTAKREAKLNLEPVDIYSNDRYSYIGYEGQLFDKEANYYCSVDIDGSLEIFKAFLTKDSAILTGAEKELLNKEITFEDIAKQEAKLKKESYINTITFKEESFYHKPDLPLENAIYYNENPVFLTYVTDDGLVIYHKRTGLSITVYAYADDNWFLMDFVTYCLGKKGKTLKKLEETFPED
jgi:hypothetical protein